MYEFQNVPEKTKPPKIPISSKKVINSLNLYCKQLSQSITKEPMLSCDYAMHHPETKYIECYKVCFFKERKYLKKGSDDPKICKNCPPAQLGIGGEVFANFGIITTFFQVLTFLKKQSHPLKSQPPGNNRKPVTKF